MIKHFVFVSLVNVLKMHFDDFWNTRAISKLCVFVCFYLFNRLVSRLIYAMLRCNEGPFDTAIELKEHLRKIHELFYCDICMKHLKVPSLFFVLMF